MIKWIEIVGVMAREDIFRSLHSDKLCKAQFIAV